MADEKEQAAPAGGFIAPPGAATPTPHEQAALEALATSVPNTGGGSRKDTTPTPPGVQLGQTALYVLPSGPSKGAVRAAVVTAVLPEGRVNLTVYLDGTKDSTYVTPSGPILTEWFGNVGYAPADKHEFGTYHIL